MIEKLKIVNQSLNDIRENIQELYKTLDFDNGDEMKFKLSREAPTIESDDFGYQGIYFFEIEKDELTSFDNWYESFRLKWMADEYKGNFTPSPVKKRFSVHAGTVQKWVPLYIGKSNYVQARLKTHFNLALEQQTFGLKLCSRMNLYGETFRIRAIDLNSDNYDLIVPHAEKYMRDKLSPIIGR